MTFVEFKVQCLKVFCYRGTFTTRGDIMSIPGGFSTPGDIMSTPGDIMSTLGAYNDECGGYHEYSGGMQYAGEIS